jgi:hypothetical protein
MIDELNPVAEPPKQRDPFPWITLDHRWIRARDNPSAYGSGDFIAEDGRFENTDYARMMVDDADGFGWVFLRLAVFRREPLLTDTPDGLQVEFMSAQTKCRAEGLAGCLRAAADALDDVLREERKKEG